mgnify:CR=1 FL=1
MSCAIQIFGTWIQPVRSSTSVSTTQAREAVRRRRSDAGALVLARRAWAASTEPTAESVPSCRFRACHRFDERHAGSGIVGARIRAPCENTTRSGSVPSVSATTAAICTRSRSAACTAALPAMMVTRLE